MTYHTIYTLHYGPNQTTPQRNAHITIAEPTECIEEALKSIIAGENNISSKRVDLVLYEPLSRNYRPDRI